MYAREALRILEATLPPSRAVVDTTEAENTICIDFDTLLPLFLVQVKKRVRPHDSRQSHSAARRFLSALRSEHYVKFCCR
jgi:hypothetical protein